MHIHHRQLVNIYLGSMSCESNSGHHTCMALSNSKRRCPWGATLLRLVTIIQVLFAYRANAKNIQVGGYSGWTNYDFGLLRTPDYAAWTASVTVEINDTLVFSYAQGSHTVNQLFSAADLASCNFTQTVMWANLTTSGFLATLTDWGYYYFSCAVEASPGTGVHSHCQQGQKLTIYVNPSASSPSSQPSPSTTPPSPVPQAPYSRSVSPGVPASSPTGFPFGSPKSSPKALSPARSPYGSPQSTPGARSPVGAPHSSVAPSPASYHSPPPSLSPGLAPQQLLGPPTGSPLPASHSTLPPPADAPGSSGPKSSPPTSQDSNNSAMPGTIQGLLLSVLAVSLTFAAVIA